MIDGITVISSNESGSQVVMAVNTRSKNAAGTIDDFRATERHRVSCMDWLTDTLVQRHQLQYVSGAAGGFMFRDDQRLPNGTVNPNQRLKPRLLTPSQWRPFAAAILTEFEDKLIQNAAAWIDAMRVNVDPNNVSRLEAGLNGRTVDLLHQTTVRLAETTPG